MKYEWRKMDKELYLPKVKPTILLDEEKQYFTVEGKGNPNKEGFKKDVELLYALSYQIRMMPKSGFTPEGYYEFDSVLGEISSSTIYFSHNFCDNENRNGYGGMLN